MKGVGNLRQWANQARFAWHARGRFDRRALLVLAGPRTGSYLLLESLNRIPGVAMKGEVINPYSVIGIRPGSRARTLRHVKGALASSPEPIVGAKLILPQLGQHDLTPAAFEPLFPDLRWVVIYREHLLAQYLSHMRARASGNWRGEASRDPMSVDVAHLLKWSRRMARRYQEALDVVTRPVCAFSYEHFASEPERLFRDRLQAFIGAEALPALPPIRPAAGTPGGGALRVKGREALMEALRAETGGAPRLRIDGRRVHLDYEPDG